MSPAASFGVRWAYDNLTRAPSPDELKILDLFPLTCDGDEIEAAKRARRYYNARGPGGFTQLWHKRFPDDEDILTSCQDSFIVPLSARTAAGKRMTIVRLPASNATDRPLSARAFLARWLMILDIRLREDPTPGEEVVFIDVGELQQSHLKNHFRGSYWKDFVWCMKSAHPLRFSEVHVINTQRLKTTSLLLLHMGLYPWRRKVVQIHANAKDIVQTLDSDYFPIDDLPFEYGGKAGAMKDLNDVWTKKLLSNAKWLQSQERKFYETELKQERARGHNKRNILTNLRGYIGSYDMESRSASCRSLHRYDDVEEAIYGAYRTLK